MRSIVSKIGKAPSLSKPLENAVPPGQRVLKLMVKAATPIYGGGTEAGVNDRLFPVRPTSIRGQLRFWWRAVRGRNYGTVEEMFQAEERFWGSSDHPSPLSARVSEIHGMDQEQRPAEGSAEGYVLFAVLQNGHSLRKEGGQFTLTLTFPDDGEAELEVRSALWGWLNFGGLGARTRRGLGALALMEAQGTSDLTPPEADLESVRLWLAERFREFGLNRPANPSLATPQLSGTILLHPAASSPLDAWKKAIEPLRDFRQGSDLARNPRAQGSKSPAGRSRWPEADTLRRIFKTWNSKHQPDPVKPDGFPRSAFGMPIQFWFKDPGEPRKTSLTPWGLDRLASPVILKPLCCGSEALSMALFLEGEPIPNLALGRRRVDNPVRDPRLAGYHNSPMKGRSPGGDALEAFRAYLVQERFQEVKCL